MKCTKHRTDGDPCKAQAVAGTNACRSYVEGDGTYVVDESDVDVAELGAP